MAIDPGDPDQVDGTVADDLVGNAHLAASGVPGLRGHPSRMPGRRFDAKGKAKGGPAEESGVLAPPAARPRGYTRVPQTHGCHTDRGYIPHSVESPLALGEDAPASKASRIAGRGSRTRAVSGISRAVWIRTSRTESAAIPIRPGNHRLHLRRLRVGVLPQPDVRRSCSREPLRQPVPW